MLGALLFLEKTVLHFFFSGGICSQKPMEALFAQCDQIAIQQ
jgi:hypothetical protein